MKDYIGINQRIPFHVIRTGLQLLLEGDIDEEYIKEQLRLDYTGENRIKKGLSCVNKVLVNNPLAELISNEKPKVESILNSKTDLQAITLALLCTAYPFAFDIVSEMGRIFKVQNIVSSEVIMKKMSSIYGSNRATVNGFYSIIPLLLELEIFVRPKKGLYEFTNKRDLSHPLAKEFVILALLFNSGKKHLSLDELFQTPWFSYFDFYDIDTSSKYFKYLKLVENVIKLKI
ncbi:MAG: hypothetical protein P9L97_00890 [Candidatus Tenebribacter davisii]|nr:hypothetical protein [Candidatus Tenebribacter davisii]